MFRVITVSTKNNCLVLSPTRFLDVIKQRVVVDVYTTLDTFVFLVFRQGGSCEVGKNFYSETQEPTKNGSLLFTPFLIKCKPL